MLWIMPLPLLAVNFKVEGVDKQIEANVLSYIGGMNYQCDALQSTITRQHKALKDQVKLAIQPFGYFNSSLTLKSNESNQCDPLLLRVKLELKYPNG